MAVWLVYAFVGGLLMGSFGNVVIYRLPRGLSVVSPPSACAACGRRLGAVDMVPVASWLFLRGRCRVCGVKISARYPLVELFCGVVFTLIVYIVPSFCAVLLNFLVFLGLCATMIKMDGAAVARGFFAAGGVAVLLWGAGAFFFPVHFALGARVLHILGIG